MIPSERAHLHTSVGTHPGMKGKNNEDHYFVSAHQIHAPKNPIPSLLAIVADGIGGHLAGEVASEIAIQTINRVVAQSDASQPIKTLKQAIIQASRIIRSQSEQKEARRGMGSTCVCAWIIGNRLYTASVGDSRLYLMRAGTIQQVTTDHTWIQEALEYGALTPEQAKNHPHIHVIRRYLGSEEDPEPDFRLRLKPEESDEQAIANQGLLLQAKDLLLLCSDGLTDLVEPEEILKILQANGREKAVNILIDLANARGGHDNITIIILEVPTLAQASPEKAAGTRVWLRLALPCSIAMGLILIIALIASTLFWIYTRPGSPTITPTSSPTPTQTSAPLPFEASPTLPSASLPTATLPADPLATTVAPGEATPITEQAPLMPLPTDTPDPAQPITGAIVVDQKVLNKWVTRN